MQKTSFLLDRLRDKRLKLVTAESCTGGMIATELTSIAGSSDVFERGFVTYSNESKIETLGVSANSIKIHGAVSATVAEEMARGAIKKSKADIAVAVTGIAGPGGGTDEKPVGLVYIAVYFKGNVKVTKNQLSGNRNEIRHEAVDRALNQVLLLLNF